MLIYYAVGRRGVQLAREASQSALPNAPVVQDRQPAFRIRTAGVLHRLAGRARPGRRPRRARPTAAGLRGISHYTTPCWLFHFFEAVRVVSSSSESGVVDPPKRT